MPIYDDPYRVGDPEPYDPPVCPVCGAEVEMIYIDRDGEVVGCDCCIETADAYDYQERERAEAEARFR